MVGSRQNLRTYLGRLLFVGSIAVAGHALAADSIKGQVLIGGAPVARSTVRLWTASTGEPKQLAQTTTGTDGRFEFRAKSALGKDTVLVVVAKGGQPTASKAAGGDNPAIALMVLLGTTVPKKVTVNELTTVASAFTAAQFIKGARCLAILLGFASLLGTFPTLWTLQPANGARCSLTR
jgi:hypothetical protein